MIHPKHSRFKPWLIGITFFTISWVVAGTHGMTTYGVLGYETDSNHRIVKLSAGMPAQMSGVLEGDLLREIEGKTGALRANQTVRMVVDRNGQTLRLKATAVARPAGYRRLRIAMGVMALGFLACGLTAFLLAGTRASFIFLLYTIGRAIHDSGQPSAQSIVIQDMFLSLTLIGMMTSASLLLHFTLLFPNQWEIGTKRSTNAWLYGPVLLAVVLAALKAAVPSTNDTVGGFFYSLTVIPTYLFMLTAIGVISRRFVKAANKERRALHLDVLLWGALIAFLPYSVLLLVESLFPSITIPGGEGSHPYTLLFIFLPLSITYTILRTREGVLRNKKAPPDSVPTLG